MPKNFTYKKKNDSSSLQDQLENYIEKIRNRLMDIQQQLTYQNLTWSCVQIAKRWIQLQDDRRTQSIQSGSQIYTNSYSTKSKFMDLDFTLQKTQLLSRKWNYRITNIFVSKSQQKTEEFLTILGLMSMILDGVFFSDDEKISTYQIKPNFVLGPCQAYFRTHYMHRFNLIYEVGIDRVPILNSQGNLIGFNYEHTITFLDIRYDAKIENQLSNIITKYHTLISQEIFRQDYSQLQSKSVYKTNISNKSRKEPCQLFNLKFNLQGEIYGEFLYNSHQDYTCYWIPNIFAPFYLTKEEQSFMVFEQSIQRWVPSDYTKVQEAKKFREYQANINKELLKRYADFSSAAKLVQLLQKIPNFKIRLTQQEQEVVGANGNVMVIGRSGTGKTTCAILRLFSMEMLFRLRLNLYKQKHQNVLLNTKIQESDLDNQVGLHCVFVTASPILTSEVKRYYTKLTEQIKQELEKKRLKDQEKRRQELINQKLEQSQFQVVDNDDKQIEEKYFEDKIGELEMKQQQEGFDSEEEVDQLEDEEDRVNAELNKFNSFEEMKDKDFPAFFTIRKLLLLIDGSLKVPFFQRNKFKKVIGSNDQANWHNDKQGVMLINKYKEIDDENDNYDSDSGDDIYQEEEEIDLTKLTEKELEQEYQRQMFLMKRQNQPKQEKTESILAQEVDYEYFVNHFWPQVVNEIPKKSGITSNFVWTQIYSHIKGSALAHKYSGWYLPEKIFEKSVKNQMKEEVAEIVFDLFIKYERWKVRYNYYDLMDVVNYMIIQIKAGRFEIMPIHYLMVDEVQDLPHAILCLLCAVTEQGLFFSGDTAQNIAKGVGFRFQDLKSLFNQQDHYDVFKFDSVNVHQLSVNFRSHNNILQLANSLVSIIEFFFPKTIDRLQKERSDIVGPKPILVTDCNPESLFQLLGSDTNKNKQQVGERLPIEFGCNQVILVKNQEAKAKIPTILQHALVLTIYEAKGLEFDDVILYNFFTDEWIGDQQWNLLHNLDIVRELIKKEDFELQITKHKQKEEQEQETELQNNSYSEKLYGYTEIDGKIELLKLLNNKHLDYNVTFFSSLCNELKSLYVAITRPRQRLIIYDDQPLHRKQIQYLWEKLDLVNLYNIETILENQEKVQLKTSPQEWRKTGLKMFRNKFYEQAMKCFKLAGDQVLIEKSTAFYLAQKGQNLTNQIMAMRNNKGLAKEDKSRLKELNKEMKQAYIDASKLFIKVGNKIKAAQCLFSAENYEEAYQIYIAEGMKREAAEAAFAQGKYKEAGDFFQEVGDFLRCIESYEKYNDYESIISALNKEKDIPLDTKTGYLRKYLPKILTQLTNQVGHTDYQQEGQAKEKKEQIIQEEDEEDSEYDDSDEEENEKKQQQQLKEQQQVKQAEEPEIEEENHLTFDKLNQLQDDTLQLVKQESLDVQSDDSQSFSVQNSQQSQSFQVENSQIENSKDRSESFQVQSENQEDMSKADLFEHLSRFDPDDQWLQCSDKKSIIESIVSKQSEHSDFSAFSYAQIQNNPNMQLVKTKGDIFIQDSVMQQLIKYISMFSEEFKFQLDNQRSKQVQLSNKIQQQEALDYMVDFILDLDLVDMSFIYLVLDILEEFKSFKLCIFVCNRYKLADKLGRYLSSIAATYSPLCINRANLETNYLINGHSRNSQIDKGLVAAHAVHNVFENINPDFLRLKYEDEVLDNTNSLGLYCYQQMILLGFWKKILYQLNVPYALKVCETYLDFSNWKFVYFTNRIHKIENQIEQDDDNELKQIYQAQLLISKKKLELSFQQNTNFDILYFDEPKDEADLSLALISMEQHYLKLFYQLVLHDQCGEHLFFRSKTMDPKVMKEDLSKIAYPKYLSLTKQVVQSFIIEHTLNQEIINQLIDALDQKEYTGIGKLKIFEASFLLLLIMELIVHSTHYKPAVDCLKDLSNNKFIKLQNALEKIIQTTISVQDSIIPQRNLFKRCLLLRYKCRIPESELFAPFFNSVFVHRSSPLIQDLISMKTQIQLQQDNFKLDENYFQDIDVEFVVSPHNAIIQLIYQRMRRSFDAFTAFRLNSQLRKINYLTQEEQIELMAQSVVAYQKKLRNLNKIHYKKEEVEQKFDLIEQYRKKEKQEEQRKQYETMMMVQQDIENANQEIGVNQDKQVEQQQGPISKRNKKNQALTKKELINCLSCVSAQYIKIDGYVREGILKLAIQSFNKALSSQTNESCHIYVKRGILFFDFLDLNHYSIQFIERNKQFKSYIHLIEFLTCRKHYTINDAAACFLQYYDYKHQMITDYEMKYISTFLILHQQIALLMSKNSTTTFILPYNYLMYFQNVQYVDETHFNVKMRLQVSNDEDPIVEVLQVFLEAFQEKIQAFEVQAIDLLIILLLNNETIRPNTLKIIQKIQAILMLNRHRDLGIQLIDKLLGEPNLILRQKIAYSYEQYQLDLSELVIINELTNEDQLNQAYQVCIEEWEAYKILNEKLVKPMSLIINKYRKYKKYNKFRNGQTFQQILHFHFNEYQLSRQMRESQWMAIYQEFTQIRKLLLTSFYSMFLDNPIDFHFISIKINILTQYEKEYEKDYRNFEQNKISIKEFNERNISLVKEMEEWKEELKQWQWYNVKQFEKNMDKLLERNRKLLTLKWMNQKAGLQLQQIQKRKKGLKRQQLLEQKKKILKI